MVLYMYIRYISSLVWCDGISFSLSLCGGSWWALPHLPLPDEFSCCNMIRTDYHAHTWYMPTAPVGIYVVHTCLDLCGVEGLTSAGLPRRPWDAYTSYGVPTKVPATRIQRLSPCS